MKCHYWHAAGNTIGKQTEVVWPFPGTEAVAELMRARRQAHGSRNGARSPEGPASYSAEGKVKAYSSRAPSELKLVVGNIPGV